MRTFLFLWLSGFIASGVTGQLVDDMAPLLGQNRDVYLTGPHTPDRQAAALLYFDQSWAWLKSPAGCGARGLGEAGKACIADRSRSGPWPWEKYYRDPIVTGHF
jgi:hypothetical protein